MHNASLWRGCVPCTRTRTRVRKWHLIFSPHAPLAAWCVMQPRVELALLCGRMHSGCRRVDIPPSAIIPFHQVSAVAA